MDRKRAAGVTDVVDSHTRLQNRLYDASYAGSLSADVVPELVRTLPTLAPPARCALPQQLLRRADQPDRGDLALLEPGRARARAVLAENRATLRHGCSPSLRSAV